jgi:hypothetical protein
MATALSYAIYLTNQTRVASLQTQYPNGVQIPPTQAAAVFGVSGPVSAIASIGSAGGVVVFPQDSSGWWPDITSSYNSQNFTLTFAGNGDPGTGFPNPYPFNTTFYWVGYFVYIGFTGSQQNNSSGNPRYNGARRWVDGFEISGALMDGGSGISNHNCREASRTPEGMGFALRTNTGSVRTHTNSAAAQAQRISWERFYVRIRTLPTGGDDNIWNLTGSVDGTGVYLLNINTSGQLLVYDEALVAYPGTQVGSASSALTVGVWYRVDIRTQFWTSAGSGATTKKAISVYLNGVLAISGNGTNGSFGNLHDSSNIGPIAGAVSRGLECDIDDWIGADEAVVAGVSYPGFDLTSGSHVRRIQNTGFGASNVGASWLSNGTAVVGDWREVSGIPKTGTPAMGLSSTVVSTTLQLATDYSDNVQYGCAAITMSILPNNVPGGAGQMGTNLGALRAVTLVGNTVASQEAIYSIPSGTATEQLPALGTLTLTHVSSATAGTTVINAIFAFAEYLGAWGPEDVAGLTWPTRTGQMNSPFPTLHVNNAFFAPVGAVRIYSGTFVGNQTGQDYLMKLAPNWIWLRDTGASASDGGIWFTGMNAAHWLMAQNYESDVAGDIKLATTGTSTQVPVGGLNTQSNINGRLYQFIAVSDLTGRNLLSAGMSHKAALVSGVNNIIDAGFTPDWLFMFIEHVSTGTTGHYVKGPGHATDTASPIDGASVASVATIAAGLITSKSVIQTDIPQTAYSAWRKADGVGGTQWFDAIQYTGDGAASRNIPLSLGGKAPIFVIVTPHNARSIVRDPSHSGTNSMAIGSGNTTTGITAGAANQITVGLLANANLIVHEVFAIAGGTTAFTNPTNPYVPAAESPRLPGIWPVAPAPTTLSPLTLTVPTQWQVNRFDLKPRAEEHL